MLSIFSCTCSISEYLLWKNVQIFCLFFKLYYLFFCYWYVWIEFYYLKSKRTWVSCSVSSNLCLLIFKIEIKTENIHRLLKRLNTCNTLTSCVVHRKDIIDVSYYYCLSLDARNSFISYLSLIHLSLIHLIQHLT